MCSPASSRSVTTQDCINDLAFAMLMELRWRVCFLGAEIDKLAMIDLSFNHDEICMNTFEYDYLFNRTTQDAKYTYTFDN